MSSPMGRMSSPVTWMEENEVEEQKRKFYERLEEKQRKERRKEQRKYSIYRYYRQRYN